MLVFDKVRHDPQAPNAYGADITYDLSLRSHSGSHEQYYQDVLDRVTAQSSATEGVA
jgi:NitT/TauT family transport system ATP-binding protein